MGEVAPNRHSDKIPAPYRARDEKKQPERKSHPAPVVVGYQSRELAQAETPIAEKHDKNPTSNLGATNEISDPLR